MGLFGGAQEPLDEGIAGWIMAANDQEMATSRKIMAKNQLMLRATLAEVDGELPVCLCSWQVGAKDAVLLVTNQRTVEIRKEAIQKQLRHEEVAETRLLHAAGGGMLVVVESHIAQQQYRPDDFQRMGHCLQGEVPTPLMANTICEAIDRHLAGGLAQL